MPRFHNINGERVQFTEAEETTWDAIQQEWEDGADARAMADIRTKRDNLLAATDWWGASDQTMSDAQTAYRSALRDVPAQSDLNNITWPTKP